MRLINFGKRIVGDGQPTYIVAEIGINHNGDLGIAERLIDAAAAAGCDAVKFQKRTPDLCVPLGQRNQLRETPWGTMTYLEYRHRIEFGFEGYQRLIEHCRARSIDWFVSCWDEAAVDFVEWFEPIGYKIPSAALTDVALLKRFRQTGRPLILSTGMSTMAQIDAAVELLGTCDLLVAHSTSTYPCPLGELNLRMIATLRARFDCPIGYSGHEVGLPTTVAATCLGACMIERHITLDRAMWGTDQAASVEPRGFERLVKYIRDIESSMGNGVKTVYESELNVMKKLRRTDALRLVRPESNEVGAGGAGAPSAVCRDGVAGARPGCVGVGPHAVSNDCPAEASR
ncbi:MAG TPA: N-acetylneuraminate synthase family protein [Vicinamibacterales bacterium]|nr:N-acetylneuraminate synthase family protein [Vicinamibacterales bacterium]